MKCINAFDCLGCQFDQKMLAKFDTQRKIGQKSDPDNRPPRMKALLNQQKCRHMLSGRVDYKICSHGYDCVKCPYDQMIEDTGYLPNLKEPHYTVVSGFNVAQDHYYHFGHTWARVEYGGRVRIGLDDFASRLLGPQESIRLPKLGQDIRQGNQLAQLERSKNEANLLSPVTGKVVATNYNIKSKAKSANQSPYVNGWFMVIQPTGLRKSLKNLFFGQESLAWMDDEAARLNTLVSEQTEYKMAATGGMAVNDIYGNVPGLDWDRLVTAFLEPKKS
jgi:glycine cleavage system H lipoate-binding protein